MSNPYRKPVMVVGEAYGEQEEQQGKPFVGPSGSILWSLLKQVGIARQEVYLTNVFNFRPPSNRLDRLYTNKAGGIPNYRAITGGKYIAAKYEPELDRLFAEIERVQPNLIIACGNTPLWALCKKSGIKQYRGSPLLTHDQRWKVLPTWHPAAIMRQWELRAVAYADMTKAKREMAYPELRRPNRYIYLEPSIKDLWDFYQEFLQNEPFISCDIETKGKQITEVGYGNADGTRALVIPFYDRSIVDGNYWRTLQEELLAWDFIRFVNERHQFIGQNFYYDMQYFWRSVHIPCPRTIGDTMLLHHALQPELEKGLGFLGSIYTDEPSWKFMRQEHKEHFKQGDD